MEVLILFALILLNGLVGEAALAPPLAQHLVAKPVDFLAMATKSFVRLLASAAPVSINNTNPS